MKFEDYPINVHPVPEDEGGGFMVSVPDLPGCIADGETLDEALAEARDAFDAWVMAEKEWAGCPLRRLTAVSSCNAYRRPCTCGLPNAQRVRG